MKQKKMRLKKKFSWMVKLLVFVTVFATAYSLILPAVTVSAQEQYCGLEEHVHSDDCEENCSLQEHVHNDLCFSNPQADLETADTWAASFGNSLSEADPNSRIASAARSQIGYVQSSANFILDEGGNRVYTSRYAQWAQNPYDNAWGTEFISFVLAYAYPQAISWPGMHEAAQWQNAAAAQGLLVSDFSFAELGDIAFYADEQGVQAAIVTGIDESSLAVTGKIQDRVTEFKLAKNGGQLIGFYSPLGTVTSDSAGIRTTNNTEEPAEKETVSADKEKPKAAPANTTAATVAQAETEQPALTHDEILANGLDLTPYVTGATVEYQRAGQTTWQAYDPSVRLNYNDRIRFSVNYANLKKADIENVKGKVWYSAPDYLVIDTGSNKIIHNDKGTSLELGNYYGCKDGGNHIHLDMNNYGNLHTDIETGTFYITGGIDPTQLKDTDSVTTIIGGDDITINFGNITPEYYAPLALSKAVSIKTDEAGNRVLSDNGSMILKYRLTAVTDKYPVPDVYIKDWFSKNPWEVKYIEDSMTIQIGDQNPVKVDESNSEQFCRNDSNSQINHVFGADQDLTQQVPAHGFGLLVGDVPANTTVVIEYEETVNVEKLKGGRFTVENKAIPYSKDVPKQNEIAASQAIESNLNLVKTLVSRELMPDGNYKYNFSIDVKFDNNHKDYTFKDVWIDDEVFMYSGNTNTKDTYKKYLKYAELDHDSVKVNGTPLDEEHIKEATSSYVGSNGQTNCGIAETSNSEGRNTKGYRFGIGDMIPGDSKKIEYSLILDKDAFVEMTLDGKDELTFNNSANVKRVTRDGNNKGFQQSYTSNQTNSSVKKTEFVNKTVAEPISQIQTVTMNGKVFDKSGNALDAESFEIPTGSYIYSVMVNKDGHIDMDNSTFTDQLSESGETTNLHVGYTGYLKVEIFENPSFSMGEIPNVIDTFYVKVDENSSSFRFKPNTYPPVQEKAKRDGPYNGYRLTYVAKPIQTEVDAPVKIGNNISSNLTVGVGGGPVINFSATSKADIVYSGESHLTAEKVGLMVEERVEDKGTPYENGRIIWLLRIDANRISSGFNLIDEIVPTEVTGTPNHKFLSDALIGVYKGSNLLPEDLSSVSPYIGLKKITYQELMDRLSPGLMESGYTASVSDANDKKIEITFDQNVTLDQTEGNKEYLYVVLQSVPMAQQSFPENGDDIITAYSNSLKYQQDDQDELVLVDKSTIENRHTRNTTKLWACDFVLQDGELKQSDQNADYSLVNNLWKSHYKNQLDLEKYSENELYTHWIIFSNQSYYSVGSNYQGTYEFYETIPEKMEFVQAFVTTIENPPASDNLVIESVEQDPANPKKVKITVSGVDRKKFFVHVVTRSTEDWSTIIAKPENYQDRGDYQRNNVDVYNGSLYLGHAYADRDVHMPGVLNKTTTNEKANGIVTGEGALDYQILLNEKSADLIAHDDKVDLVDTFDPNQFDILVNTIKVVYGDGENAGKAVSGYNVSLNAISSDRKELVIANLPDNRYIKVTYQAQVRGDSKTPTVNVRNSVTWRGLGSDTPVRDNQQNYSFSLAATSVGSSEYFNLTKYDSHNASGDKLPGAVFTLSEGAVLDSGEPQLAEDGSPVFGKTYPDLRTGNDGILHSTNYDNLVVKKDTLYMLEETEAPEGYILSEEKLYFIFVTNNDVDTSWCPKGTLVLKAGKTAELQFANSKPSCTIQIVKSFNKNLVPGTYLFGLYKAPYNFESPDPQQRPEKVESLKVAVSDSGTEAGIAFNNVELGSQYYIYELDETGTPIQNGSDVTIADHKFTVEYLDEAGNLVDTTGDKVKDKDTVTVHIQNRPWYRLPETGGTGTWLIQGAGTALIAAVALSALKKKNQKD